jgi:hypothetical protein
LDKCSWEWASLPPNRYGQSVMDPKRVYATYDKWLKPNTVVATPTAKEKKVDPFTLTALTALLSNIPTLIRTFGKGTKSEENAKLAEVLIPMATQAVGAVNEQDLVTKIKNDPSAVTTIDQAVKDNLWQLVEAGGGGIEGAREYNLKVADKPMWHQPAFVISVILLLFPLLLCIDVFMLHSDQYSSELRTQIVTAVLLTFGMVGGFWLGSSFTTSSTRGIGAERK